MEEFPQALLLVLALPDWLSLLPLALLPEKQVLAELLSEAAPLPVPAGPLVELTELLALL